MCTCFSHASHVLSAATWALDPNGLRLDFSITPSTFFLVDRLSSPQDNVVNEVFILGHICREFRKAEKLFPYLASV